MHAYRAQSYSTHYPCISLRHTVRNVWPTALHLFRGMNTDKLIHSLLHSIGTIRKCHPNDCVRGSEYIYSSHLMALDTCKPAVGEYSPSNKLPHHSPLKVEFWSHEWASHIDCGYIAYLLEGIANRSQ